MPPVSMQKRPRWRYAVIAGLVFVVICLPIGLLVRTGMHLYKTLSYDPTNMGDPTEHMMSFGDDQAQAEEILGTLQLRDKYFPWKVSRSPTGDDWALLLNYVGVPRSEHDRRPFFFFFHLRHTTMDDVMALSAYLEGRSGEPAILSRRNITFLPREVLGRGKLHLQHDSASYLVQRGMLVTHFFPPRPSGISTLILFECPGSSDIRAAWWVAPEPLLQPAVSGPSLKGTPADPEALRDFLSFLRPCAHP